MGALARASSFIQLRASQPARQPRRLEVIFALASADGDAAAAALLFIMYPPARCPMMNCPGTRKQKEVIGCLTLSSHCLTLQPMIYDREINIWVISRPHSYCVIHLDRSLCGDHNFSPRINSLYWLSSVFPGRRGGTIIELASSLPSASTGALVHLLMIISFDMELNGRRDNAAGSSSSANWMSPLMFYYIDFSKIH